MKKIGLLGTFFSIVLTTTAVAQRDTSDLPLVHKIVGSKFYLVPIDKKIALLDSFHTAVPEPEQGKLTEQYDLLRSEIILAYLKEGDSISGMNWWNKLRTNVGKIKTSFRWSGYLLEKDEKNNAAKAEALLKPLVDSAARLFKQDSSKTDLYNAMMPVYVKTLLALNKQDVIAYHLGALYEVNKHKFPTDAKNRVVTKPENYKITNNLSYDYGMALAATGRHKESITVLARLYLTGVEVSDKIQADIKGETTKMKGGAKYYQHLTDSVHKLDNNKLNAFAASKKDIQGQPVNFATLKGKYVLLDFWGSWCKPCRASHPHLKELYSKYKNKGFEIIGIAMESAKTPEERHKAWADAVQADGLTWLQVLNNEQLERFDAVKEFGVTAFPTKILLDKEGNIIGRYVGSGSGGEEFGTRLKELLGE